MIDVRSQPALGDYLVREGIISQSQLNRVLEEQQATTRSIGRILVDLGYISESARMTILQKRFNYELIRLKDVEVDPLLLTMIPRIFAEKHRGVPVRQEEDHTLVVAMEDPSDILVADAIKSQIGLRIKSCVASHDDVQMVLDQYHTQERIKKAQQSVKTNFRDGRSYKILRYAAFPILAFAPLVLFFLELYLDLTGFPKALQKWLTEGIISTWDLFLYFCLSWGLWTIILFEINGLIFGQATKEEDEI